MKECNPSCGFFTMIKTCLRCKEEKPDIKCPAYKPSLNCASYVCNKNSQFVYPSQPCLFEDFPFSVLNVTPRRQESDRGVYTPVQAVEDRSGSVYTSLDKPTTRRRAKKTTILNVRIDPTLKERLYSEAEKIGKSPREVIEGLVSTWLNGGGQP